MYSTFNKVNTKKKVLVLKLIKLSVKFPIYSNLDFYSNRFCPFSGFKCRTLSHFFNSKTPLMKTRFPSKAHLIHHCTSSNIICFSAC